MDTPLPIINTWLLCLCKDNECGMRPTAQMLSLYSRLDNEKLKSFIASCQNGGKEDIAFVDNMLHELEGDDKLCLLFNYTNKYGETAIDIALAERNTGIMQVIYKHLHSMNVEFLRKCEPLKLLTKKNKYKMCAMHDDRFAQNNVDLLNRYSNEFIFQPVNNGKYPTLSECFPEFSIDDSIPYTEMYVSHPLTVVGESGNLILINHPYVKSYVNLCWHSLARYIYYLHLFLYLVFLGSLCSFVAIHEIKNIDNSFELGNITQNSSEFYENQTVTSNRTAVFVTQNPGLAYTSAGMVLIIAVFGLIFEFFQARTTGWYYFQSLTNYFEIFVFLASITLISVGLNEYGSTVHVIICIVIPIATIRGVVLLTHFPLIGIQFQMLITVTHNVVMFLPMLLFLLFTFATIFKSLLHNQESFSNLGMAMMKVMVMSIGELEYESIFDDASNEQPQEIIAFLMFIPFLGIMTISVTNLLIGIAVGDIDQLRKRSAQITFKSQVDFILHFASMFPKTNKEIHEMSFAEFTRATTCKGHIKGCKEGVPELCLESNYVAGCLFCACCPCFVVGGIALLCCALKNICNPRDNVRDVKSELKFDDLNYHMSVRNNQRDPNSDSRIEDREVRNRKIDKQEEMFNMLKQIIDEQAKIKEMLRHHDQGKARGNPGLPYRHSSSNL